MVATFATSRNLAFNSCAVNTCSVNDYSEGFQRRNKKQYSLALKI